MINLTTRYTNHRIAVAFLLAISLMVARDAFAQSMIPKIERLTYNIKPGEQRVRIPTAAARIVQLKGKSIPKVLVENPEVVTVIALSKNRIQMAGEKSGVTRVSIWDEDGELYTLIVTVHRDGTQLQNLLDSEFPAASVRVRPLETSVVLSGWVDEPEIISLIVRMAEDYYPKVINNLRVGNNQQVMLHVRVMEISRTKLRQLGIDWAGFGSSGFAGQTVSGLLGQTTANTKAIVAAGGSTVTMGVADGASSLFAVIDALQQNDLAKILAEPVLTTISGRAASFNAGGEFPIVVPQGLGTVGVQYKSFGTSIDFVPIVMGDGNIRLEVRPEVSELDNARGADLNGFRLPGVRTRKVDTAVEMRAGQTLAIAGLIQDRVEAQNRGLPVLGQIPLAGALFRRVVYTTNEIELLILVRPEFVDAMDPEQVPVFGPGTRLEEPSDHELFLDGLIDKHNCGQNGISCLDPTHNHAHSGYPAEYGYENMAYDEYGNGAIYPEQQYSQPMPARQFPMHNNADALAPISPEVAPLIDAPNLPAPATSPVPQLPLGPVLDFGLRYPSKMRAPVALKPVASKPELAPVVTRNGGGGFSEIDMQGKVRTAAAWSDAAESEVNNAPLPKSK